MNYKLEYITRMLTKISHKRLESYVIHRIWNTLDNPDVHFVFQQYVVRKEGKEADTIREREISKLVDIVRVKCYNEINGIAEPCSLEELNLRTDEATNLIKSKIAELGTDFKA